MGRQDDVRGESRASNTPRPRYSRLTAAGAALGVTLVAVLGGAGVLPRTTGPAEALAAQRPVHDEGPKVPSERSGDRDASAPVPRNSGSGRRIVFDMSDQRVWLVTGGADVRRTYPVSGSVTDNLQPGTYSVYSKSLHAWGIEDSGTMQYMVRFAHGRNAAIGFHDIPVLDGATVQTRAELGSPRSHGCIRQWRPDAKALWRFAPVGTKVVVVA